MAETTTHLRSENADDLNLTFYELNRGSMAKQAPASGLQRHDHTRFASLVGTTVEFYDFYVFATAATQLFGPLFFSPTSSSAQLLAAYGTFAIAFFARPVGGAIFGHFGDRVGRKTTLVVSLLLTGVPTAATGFLPTYATIGWLAPVLLCVLRFGQGLAIGGEWAGAALLAVENAPPGWRGRFGMFAPLGVPCGYILANGMFLVLNLTLTPEHFREWGWRIPFIASAPLVWFGLWIRTHLMETTIFSAAMASARPVRVPLIEVCRGHLGQVLLGAFGAVACFAIYYLATAFALGYGTSVSGFSLNTFLVAELGAHLLMVVGVLTAGWLSDRATPARALTFGHLGTILCGLLLPFMLGSHSLVLVCCFLSLALFVMGYTNGPLGAWLPSLFPPRVRYTGVSFAFNLGGILGGALTPIFAQWLAVRIGLLPVGLYLAASGLVSLLALDISTRRETHRALAQSERRYRSMFEQASVPICEVDLSKLRSTVRQLQQQGAGDLQAYLNRQPEFLERCAQHITLIDANDAAVRMLEAGSRAELTGRFDRFLPPGIEPLLSILEAIWNGERRFESEVRLVTRKGSTVTLLLIIALPEDERASNRVVFAMIDITERERARDTLFAAREELARAGRVTAVGALSASIAHELKQPLGALVIDAQSCMRWLMRAAPDINEASLAAQRTVQNARQAANIIERTRHHMSHARREPEAVDLRDAVRTVAELFEHDLATHAITLNVRIVPALPLIAADPIGMQQVFANLISNAIRSIAQTVCGPRTITVEVERDRRDWLTVRVRDTGTGLAEEHLGRIFEPFFTTRADGMGIGLAICRSMVGSYGGVLSARNEAGGGATFEVAMPSFQLAHTDIEGPIQWPSVPI